MPGGAYKYSKIGKSMKNDIHLVAYYFMKPRATVRTHLKGWSADPNNFEYDEKVEIFRGLRNSAVTNAKVILNLSQTKVVKNSYNREASFDELFAYYYKNYSDYVTMTLAKLDPESFKTAFDNAADNTQTLNT